MLTKVIIRGNQTDRECEDRINKAIAEYPNNEVIFEMLIENTATLIGGNQETLYTLMIRIEDGE